MSATAKYKSAGAYHYRAICLADDVYSIQRAPEYFLLWSTIATAGSREQALSIMGEQIGIDATCRHRGASNNRARGRR